MVVVEHAHDSDFVYWILYYARGHLSDDLMASFFWCIGVQSWGVSETSSGPKKVGIGKIAREPLECVKHASRIV